MIEPYDDGRLDAIVRLSLRAWAPVFESMREAMGSAVFRAFYRDDWFKKAGKAIAMVETGADPGHAPARRAYEAAGFRLLPVARYFKSL